MRDLDDGAGANNCNAQGFRDAKFDAGVFWLDVLKKGNVAFWAQEGGSQVDEGRGKVVCNRFDERAQRRNDRFENGFHRE